jgi:hypothetical protein
MRFYGLILDLSLVAHLWDNEHEHLVIIYRSLLPHTLAPAPFSPYPSAETSRAQQTGSIQLHEQVLIDLFLPS